MYTHSISKLSLQRAEGDADALGGAVVHDRVAQVVPGHARQAVERAGGEVDRAHVGQLQGARRHLLASVGVPEQQPAQKKAAASSSLTLDPSSLKEPLESKARDSRRHCFCQLMVQ